MAVRRNALDAYDRARDNGESIRRAAMLSGISLSTAQRREKVKKEAAERALAEQRRADGNEPIPYDDLAPAAKRALNDFGYFQRRYFGRIATPWQVHAANQIVQMLESPEKEYCVLNAPPGVGKSTTFCHDIPAWLTCRDRRIRGQIGSRTSRTAATYVQRLKRTFERTAPVKNDSKQIELGLALDAEATLMEDFGRFKPGRAERWSNEEFVVMQPDGDSIDEKEPTWSAWGFDSSFLGMRYDIILWDDVVNQTNIRTAESIEKLQADWDDMAETRLEPEGLLVLQGQRLSASDLYRYCLDKKITAEEDEEGNEIAEDEDRQSMYHHIVYRAHYEDKCRGLHKKTDLAFDPARPDESGCLLEPRRLSWGELRAKMANPRNNFPTVYQQEDTDEEGVLVKPVWIHGGEDHKTRIVHYGCLDDDRDVWEWPKDVHGQFLTYATVDPSPTKFWSIQLWSVLIINGKPQQRYLIDHYRGKLTANSFLDRKHGSSTEFVGVAEDWTQRARRMGHPIGYWILEKNAAQRWVLQYDHTKEWAATRETRWVAHETGVNKHDAEMGIRALLPRVYADGLVRLPYKRGASFAIRGNHPSSQIIAEVTHWPDWPTDDCVMSQWFGETNLDHLLPTQHKPPAAPRPMGILRNASTFVGRPWKGQRNDAADFIRQTTENTYGVRRG